MDFALTEQQELIRKEVATLARAFSLDYWLEKDRKAEYPWDWVKTFAQAGWLGMIIPEEYGGSGLGVIEAALMLHEICASGAGTSGDSPIHFFFVGLLARKGREGRVPVGLGEDLRPSGLARVDHPGGVRRLRPRRHRGGAHAPRDLALRRRHLWRLAHPFLSVPADAGDQARRR